MKILLTGGAGFIGSHVVEVFAPFCEQITVVDNFSSGHNIFSLKNVSYIKGDISDIDSLPIPHEYDLLIHLAAAISVAESVSDPDKYRRINVDGSLVVYKFAVKHNIPQVISASSAAVYGDCGSDKITEDFKYNGISPYAESKYKMEQLADQFRDTQVRFAFPRFFNVYGPRQDPTSPYTGVLSIFIARAIAQKTLTIFGDGLQTRDFVYVGDIVAALKHIYENKLTGSFNVGTQKSITVMEVAKILSDDIKLEDARKGDVKHSKSDCSKLMKTGWSAKVGLKEGLEATKAWAGSK